MPKRRPKGVREGVREPSGSRPGGAREAPEKVPEKGPIRRFWPSAAGGADNAKITAIPREAVSLFRSKLSNYLGFLTILQTRDFR